MELADLTPSSRHYRYRENARHWLGSKYQHCLLLTFITLDVFCIFADIFISLYTCDVGRNRPATTKHRLKRTQEGLTIISFIFSCIFLLELIVTLWAFGLRHLKSGFHIFDATVIIAGFVLDVVLRGVNAEVASLVVLLRLFGFIKIIEEIENTQISTIKGLNEEIKRLRDQNLMLRKELAKCKQN